MKNKVFILSFLFTATVYSQVDVKNNLISGKVDSTRTTQNIELKYRIRVPKQALVFNLGYNIPSINNSIIRSDFWNKKTGTGLGFGMDFRRQIQKKVIEKEELTRVPTWIALGIGLGINNFQKSIWFDTFKDTFKNHIDIDGDKCDVYLQYRNVTEKVSLTYLDIPLYLEIGKLSRIKTSAYFKVGVKASVLISGKKKREYEGTYTSTAYYKSINGTECHVVLDDVDVLGYFNDKSCYGENPKDTISSFVLWGTISAGINFPFSSLENNKLAQWILRIDAKIDYSLSPVSKPLPKSDFDFEGSKFRLNQTNILGGDKGSRIFSPGFSISLIYCL